MDQMASPTTSPSPRFVAWRRHGRRVLAVSAGLALAAIAAYLRVLAPVAAVAHPVERGTVVERVFGRGTIESAREVQLGFDLVGRLSDILVDEGARVTLGQELARLTPDQVEADLRVATRGVSAARASLSRLAAEERRARALVTAAEREQRRAAELRARGAVSEHELDIAADQLRVARAELDRVLAQRGEATRSIEVAAGGAEQRRVTALRATLLAPFDGLVTRRLREPGDTVAVGTTVLRIADTSDVHVSVWLDETVLARLAEDRPAEIVLPGGGGPVRGQLTRIGWESDRQTHEIIVDVTPSAPLGRIAIGQRADAWIELSRRDDVLRVPTATIGRDAEGSYADLDRDGRIARVRIRTGVADRDAVEVVDGLSEGDVLLASPTPGQALPVGRRWSAP